MGRDEVDAIRNFVEQATLELTERVAAALDAWADWNDVARLPYIPTTKLDSALDAILQSARSAGRRPSELAFALRSARAVEARRRVSPQIELVLSGPAFPPFEMRRTDEAILELIQSARYRVTLISFALYRIDRVAQALRDAVERGVSIRLFGDADKMQYTDIDTIFGQTLVAQMDVYGWTSSLIEVSQQTGKGVLHAKATVADSDHLFITSANLTEYAMSLNVEVGVLISGGDHARRVEHLFDTYVARGLFEKLSHIV